MTNPFRIQSENTENAMNTLLIMQMTNPIRKKCNDISAEMEIQYFCAEGIDLLKISKLMKKLCKVEFRYQVSQQVLDRNKVKNR